MHTHLIVDIVLLMHTNQPAHISLLTRPCTTCLLIFYPLRWAMKFVIAPVEPLNSVWKVLFTARRQDGFRLMNLLQITAAVMRPKSKERVKAGSDS